MKITKKKCTEIKQKNHKNERLTTKSKSKASKQSLKSSEIFQM